MIRHREFDVAEMSLSSYSVSLFRRPQPFIAIPVFPSRLFRHSSIYVNAAAGIREPKDLIGKRIGVPEYQMTAPVSFEGSWQSITASRSILSAISLVVKKSPGGRKAGHQPAGQHQGEADSGR